MLQEPRTDRRKEKLHFDKKAFSARRVRSQIADLFKGDWGTPQQADCMCAFSHCLQKNSRVVLNVRNNAVILRIPEN